ncbi:hypothetical protein GCM10011506_45720 [Marivirga lumbricoides]|uniref:DUF4260 domain-containing protein n=2 Tax=Marivirga lumbricoides TaxID=1046115 RepID=A0ABQ1N6G0_9BACT|nr:hypothetical protein GCM10011506_45720 [Marivirga lumbricoides]
MTPQMNTLLKAEEVAQFALSIILFAQLDYAWWVFPAFLLLPDLSMLGYLLNSKVGARLYNLFHHKLLAIIILALGVWANHSELSFAGIILFGHSAMDRIFGYGLKYEDDFKHTHLGWMGKKA